MKKLMLLLLLFVPVFFACSDDDDDNGKQGQVTAIQLDDSKTAFNIGDEYQFQVAHTPKEVKAPAYAWTSTLPAVASVDAAGKIKALTAGKTTITVSVPETDLTSSVEITVLAEGEMDIKLDKSVHKLLIGESFKLSYTITPKDKAGEPVEWSSSDESIATVDKDGNVKAKAKGVVAITACLTNNKSQDVCVVNVKDKESDHFAQLYVGNVAIQKNNDDELASMQVRVHNAGEKDITDVVVELVNLKLSKTMDTKEVGTLSPNNVSDFILESKSLGDHKLVCTYKYEGKEYKNELPVDLNEMDWSIF